MLFCVRLFLLKLFDVNILVLFQNIQTSLKTSKQLWDAQAAAVVCTSFFPHSKFKVIYPLIDY